jgi:hypothetical protein
MSGVRPGRNETLDQATLCIKIRGRCAIAFEVAPEAQRQLCEEIGRMAHSIIRGLSNHEEDGPKYHVTVYPIRLREEGIDA